VLKEFKNNKSPGSDGINLELFKYADGTLKSRYTELLNRTWHGETPPECWLKALVIPIYKKNYKDCESYRGISLTNAGYKIFAKGIKHKLENLYRDVISEEQSGFRKGRLCVDGYFSLKLLRKNIKNSPKRPTWPSWIIRKLLIM
jgi:hypothetical protein